MFIILYLAIPASGSSSTSSCLRHLFLSTTSLPPPPLQLNSISTSSPQPVKRPGLAISISSPFPRFFIIRAPVDRVRGTPLSNSCRPSIVVAASRRCEIDANPPPKQISILRPILRLLLLLYNSVLQTHHRLPSGQSRARFLVLRSCRAICIWNQKSPASSKASSSTWTGSVSLYRGLGRRSIRRQKRNVVEGA